MGRVNPNISCEQHSKKRCGVSKLEVSEGVIRDMEMIQPYCPLAKKNSAVKQASQPKGLLLNVKKTQIMVIDNNMLEHTDFMIYGVVSEVEEFVYLGSKITKECSCRTEVRRRLAMARTATLDMTSIWKNRVSKKLKTRL